MTQVDNAAPAPGSAAAPPNPSEDEFTAFFRASYRRLLRTALYAGAGKQEAEDAISAAMEDILCRWSEVEHPYPYARRAMLNHFYKARTRGLDRVRQRQVARGDTLQDGEDAALTVWEDRQWVDQLLASLPPAQRQVMEGILADLTTAEIGVLLGKTPAAVRQNLVAARRGLKAVLLQERAPFNHSPASPKKGV
ncbi:RNA polymerase sigma factor [Parafrankia discariae]|uniref:RNA polymerase sigma factor n=1 Tax=Parafrankia discariae TaxID=365528 RepID=UPI00036F5CF3|nr:sigma-70 family RNA polymerase sigma factor [Parafrankia discariae]